MSLQKHCASYATTMVTTLLYKGMDLGAVRMPDKKLRMWNVTGGAPEPVAFAGTDYKFTPDGKILAVDEGTDVSLWDVDGAKQIAHSQGKLQYLSSSLLITTSGSKIMFWSPQTGSAIREITSIGEVNYADVSEAAGTLAILSNQDLELFDIESGVRKMDIKVAQPFIHRTYAKSHA